MSLSLVSNISSIDTWQQVSGVEEVLPHSLRKIKKFKEVSGVRKYSPILFTVWKKIEVGKYLL